MYKFLVCFLCASIGGFSVEPIEPIPLTIDLDQKKVSLGELVFHDKGLSKNDSISCASCHEIKFVAADHNQGIALFDGLVVPVNVPTLFNVAFNPILLSTGGVDNLEGFFSLPVILDVFGLKQDEIVSKLKKNGDYVKKFKEIYNDEITVHHIGNALAEYQKSLTTPNSRFDKWLRGDSQAITEDELKGYQLFKGLGCVNCHNGVGVGANSFQKMGIAKDYFGQRGNVTEEDYGRFKVTKNEYDRFRLKVPTLRNVELTYPYFYDGTVKTLDEAVRKMGEYQLGENLSDEQVALIVKFLKTLTGEYKGAAFEK